MARAARLKHTKTLAICAERRLPHGERRLVRLTVRYAGQHDTGWLKMGFVLALVVARVEQFDESLDQFEQRDVSSCADWNARNATAGSYAGC